MEIDFWRETGSFVAGNEKLLSVIIWALPLVSEDSVKQAAFRDGKASYNDIVWWPNIQSRD